MSLEENKNVVRSFADLYTKGDWDALRDLLSDDFRWVVPVVDDIQSPLLKSQKNVFKSGDRSRDETVDIFRHVQGTCVDNRFDVEIVSLTAEEDRVAAEAKSHAVSKANGRTYQNRYTWIVTLRDGKITRMIEYQDTQHVLDVWLAPQ